MADSTSSLLAPYTGPWDERAAAHLLNRVCFSAPIEQIEMLMKQTPDQALQRLLYYEYTPESCPDPSCAEPSVPSPDAVPKSQSNEQERQMQRKEQQRMEKEHGMELQAWWIQRMVTTPRPLQEKLTLFWHGHFATSFVKVKNAYLMWLQNETLRRNANGNFKKMLLEISRDPAMIVWLDNNSNVKGKPNENYAREVMELFTLGEGHYTEQDIKESARAFTGWSYRKQGSQQFQFQPKQHDVGEKVFMGKKGNWDGDDIINIIFEQPHCARFIVNKLWVYFAYENPEPEVVDGLAQILRENNYDLKPLLWKLFSCRAFYSERAIHAQIKSPAQLVVGSFQILKRELPDDPNLLQIILNVFRLMGQELFAPPDVDGWDGGLAWVNTASLLLRYNFSNYLVHGIPPENMVGKIGKAGKPPSPPKGEVTRALRRSAKVLDVASLCDLSRLATSEQIVRHFARLLWNDQPDQENLREFTRFLDTNESGGTFAFQAQNPAAEEKIRGLVHLMMSTPQYQLC